MQDKSISSSQLGWGTIYNSENAKDLDETGETAAIRHTINDIYSPEKQKFLGENVSYLDSIIQICQNHNAKVIFVTTPAYKTYREHLNEEQLNIMLKTVNKITNDYSNCTYINLLADSTFVSTDYYDADHLSEIGAEKLSLLINRYIEESEK
ncbi:hypothetical protein FACS1894123_09090 [Bacteroidia bacterium]|nr:hypothetical protein FACS1894123_09090 [Bacteroidia bacterium]